MIGRRKPRKDPVTPERAIAPSWRQPRVQGYRKPRKERTCPVCQTVFAPYPSETLNAAGKFCSRACYYAHVGRRPAMLDAMCEVCGGSFRRTAAALKRVRHSFCSVPCRQSFYVGEANGSFRGGHSSNRGRGWAALARSIRERDGHRCRRCGKTAADNRQALSVDHVIPWRTFSDHSEANRPENLVALCRSCHSKKQHAEFAWLKGDVLDMWRYQVAVAQPWTKP